MENADTTDRTSTHHVGAEPITDTVLRAVADRKGCSQLELPLLYDHIDPDALDALVSSARESPANDQIVIEFEYAGYTVCIAGTQTIELHPAPPSQSPVLEHGQAD